MENFCIIFKQSYNEHGEINCMILNKDLGMIISVL